MATENFSTFVSATSAAGSLAGTEPIPVISGGVTKQTTAAAIKTYIAALIAANNLSDVTDQAAARSNLGLGTSATQDKVTFGASGVLDASAIPTLPADATKYLDGTGAWTVPAGGGGSGTVTSITAGVGLNGGTITTSGTIDLADTAVTAGSYTSANITVDRQGRITAAANGSGGGGTVATDSTLTGDGSGGSPLGIKLSNANSWTALQTFVGDLGTGRYALQANGLLYISADGAGYTQLFVTAGSSAAQMISCAGHGGGSFIVTWDGSLRINTSAVPFDTPGVLNADVAGSGSFSVLGATPVGQQATPTTLGDVIAILQAFGFCS